MIHAIRLLSKTESMNNTFDYRSIKTFEDACKHLGINADEINRKYQFLPDHIISFIKLEIITKALNNGWRNALDCNEYSYYNWCYTLTDKEAEKFDWNGRVKIHYQRPDGTAGLGFAHSTYGWLNSYSSLGSRLAYRTREIAWYSLNTFTMLWESFWFPQTWHREAKTGASEW